MRSLWIAFLVVAGPWLSTGGLTVRAEDQAPPKLAPAIQPYVDSHTLAGAVLLVADRTAILDVETVGYADREAKTSMKPDSLFWIASMSKPVTAAALMILVDEGKVDLDAPVEKYLPEFKNLWLSVEKDDSHILLKRPGHPPTVRECLSHTSGLPFKSDMEVPTLDCLPLRDAVRSYTLTPLIYEPGTQYQYSNAGINTAGRIIEVVSGMSYESFLDSRLFHPLGMTDTTFWPTEAQVTRLAKGYKPNGQKTELEETRIGQLQYPLSSKSNRYPMPGGGLFSTATDVAKFCQMILNQGRTGETVILSPNAVRELTRRQTPAAVKESYGLGFSTSGDSFGHGGAMATNMTIDRSAGLILVYLVQHSGYANSDGGEILPTFHRLARETFGKQN